MKRLTWRMAVWAAGATMLVWGCSSGPAERPDEGAQEDRAALLDEPVERRDRQSPRQQVDVDDGTLYVVPQADAEPARSIDADPEGWDLSDLRTFADVEFVREGAHRWEGPEDASFSMAIDADESYLYFWIEVVDDRLVRSDPSNPKDAVVIWLRDPAADEILAALPETLQAELNVRAETAIAITPDRRIARYGGGPPIPEGSVHVATARTDDGYRMEVAIGLEAVPVVRFIPLVDVAFRVEVLDSDDSGSSGPETILTMLPRRADGEPRFAVYDTGGLLPREAPEHAPPRYDALGVWEQGPDGWDFRALEYISPWWVRVPDRVRFEDEIADPENLPEICTGRDQERRLIEGYESARGDVRVGLAVCGRASVRGQCPSGAETQVVWFALRRVDQAWRFDRAHGAFLEPLAQCVDQGRPRERFYRDFSMVPLDVIGSSVWAVGWHAEQEEHQLSIEEAGATFVDPRAEHFVVGMNPLRSTVLRGLSRRLQQSRVFLTDLSGDPGMDICEIETVEDQECRRFGENCTTVERGLEVLTHVKTWNADAHRLEDYLMHRHPRCRASQGFEDLDGYELLLVRRRLGLLPGPARQE